MSSPMNMLWVEKYRPPTLENLALPEATRNLLEGYTAAKEIPHLLFTGPAGTGKTTVAKILIRAVDCDVMMLNASKDRGLDVIRDKVITFAKSLGFHKWKIVFMDEADGLTPDAQNSMRNAMEDYSEQTRFILTANSLSKIITPIQSRCTSIEFGETPVKERVLILKSILESEGVEFDLGVALEYANRYTDLRRMIVAAQRSVIENKGKLGHADAAGVFGGEQILRHIFTVPNWDAIVAVASTPNVDFRQLMISMFWSVGDVPMKKPATVRHKLATAVHNSQWTPDPVVHFLGTCAELIDI